jgi:lysophospholipase L1-like esterase
MSAVMHRVRACSLACAAAAIATLGVLALAPAAGASTLGGTYLALGDSLTYGFHQAQFEEELSKGNVEPATFDEGYVDDFAAVLKLANPGLQVINDGCPGETSETFIKGSGIPPAFGSFCAGGPHGTPFPYSFLHHPYSTTSQLSDALSILASNHNVSPISLDIGANDVLQFLETTCGFPATDTCTPAQVTAEYEHIASNVASILAQLRAAAPHAQIVVIGNYNPFPTVTPNGDQQLAELNGLLAKTTAKVSGASFTSVEPAFNPSGFFGGPESGDIPTVCKFTAMCPGGTFNPASPEADIHPTKLGYQVMAAFETADFLTH